MKTTITISNRTTIRPLSRVLAEAIKKELTFINPEWIENNNRGYSNHKTPKHIYCWIQGQNYIDIPRAFTNRLLTIINELNIEPEILDQRRQFSPLGLKFYGQLRPYQQEAVNVMLTEDFGTLNAPTGSGKTVMALAIASIREQPFVVIVHTKELLDQWIERIDTFLHIKAGVVASGKFNVGKQATVALVQTLYKDPDKLIPKVGFLIQDEVHRCPAKIFREAVAHFDCKFMLGISATPYRRDSLTKLIHWFVGEEIHQIERAGLEDEGSILTAIVIARNTNFTTDVKLPPPPESGLRNWGRKYGNYSQIISELTKDSERNFLIVNDVEKEIDNGICLILTDRKVHASILVELLAKKNIVAECLTAESKDRQEIVARLNSGQARAVVATGQLIGEGFDCKGLSTLFLTTPIKFSGRLVQYLGRVLRPAPGKEQATVYDYVDGECSVLMSAYRSRRKVYRKLGWEEITK